MAPSARFTITLCTWLLLVSVSGIADAQRRAVPRPPSPPAHAVVVRGHVFIGGYFYDPMFGPYPWWPRTAYPYWYFPVYDNRAEVRLRVEPQAAEEAAVYVDGFYAGIVDDFNGVFQSLPLTPGGHVVTLYLEGYRTIRRNVYLSPGSSLKLHATMERLPAGLASEPPDIAPPVPAPPRGTYRTPTTPPRIPPPAPAPRATEAAGFGTLDLCVQPASADVTIDGQRWSTSDEGHFIVRVPAGTHRVEVSKPGYRRFATELEVGDGETVPLNVSLMTPAS